MNQYCRISPVSMRPFRVLPRSRHILSASLSGSLLSARVSPSLSLKARNSDARPSHHVDDTRTRFQNPWESFRPQTASQWITALPHAIMNNPVPPRPDAIASVVPSQIPHFSLTPETSDKIKATWLGHASFFVELPAPVGAFRGARILFDPALSTRCSVVQWAGPTRYSHVPCSTEDLPAIDAVVISHNHYDHMDEDTLKLLNQLHQPHIFAPLGNDGFLESFGYPKERRHIMDWWDSSRLSLALPALSNGSGSIGTHVDIACTPAQHTANRTPTDRWRSLWSSWAISSSSSKVFFGGDTGYRTVRDGENEDEVPVCPAFREIGDQFGGFDLALLPIGAYAPRAMWSCVHASPADAVEIFKDVKAKKALGMHWGAWILTTEPIAEPPQKLREACAKSGLDDGEFDICALGETRVF